MVSVGPQNVPHFYDKTSVIAGVAVLPANTTPSYDANAAADEVGPRQYAVSDATLTWIQSCGFSLCYMSSPLANAILRIFPPRLVMIGVSLVLCLSFVAAAELGKALWSKTEKNTNKITIL